MTETELVAARLLLSVVEDAEHGREPHFELLQNHPDWESVARIALAELNGDGGKIALRRAIAATGNPERFEAALRAADDERRVADEDLIRSLAQQRRPMQTAVPVGGVPTVPSWPVLDPAALHGLVGDVVRTVEPHTESDAAALLLQLLAGFGNVVGPAAHFVVEADRHPSILFVVLVGETSKARKGTSLGHVRRIFRQIDVEWESRRMQSGLSSGEGLIHAVRDPETEDTPALDRRLMIVESEFASTLRVIERDGNTLSPVVRDAWDARTLQVMTRHNPLVATGAHIAIIGHITAEELRRHLNRTEIANGFANRYLWACSRRSKCLPLGGKLRDEDLEPLVRALGDRVEAGRHTARVEFDDAAKQVWKGVYPSISEGRPGLLGAITSRAEAQVVRLGLIYALLDQSPTIGVPHLEAALAVWSYCDTSAKYIFGDALGDPIADQVLAGLRAARPAGMTETEINGMLGRNQRADVIQRALHRLLLLGRATSVVEETGGRPATRWFAVDGVTN